MHQVIVAHDPRDIDMEFPMVETPFFSWLGTNSYSVFSVAFRRYLGIEKLPREACRGILNDGQNACYRYIFQHFWYLKLRESKTWKSKKRLI